MNRFTHFELATDDLEKTAVFNREYSAGKSKSGMARSTTG